MDRDGVEVHKTRKNITRSPSSHLGQTSLVNKGFIIWRKNTIFLWDIVGNPRGQDRVILPARIANHSAGFGSSCPLINNEARKSLGGGVFISTQSSTQLSFSLFWAPHLLGKGK